MRMILPVLLSGGSGSRLWPLSRELMPKQLLPLGCERPLVVEAALRTQDDGFLPPIVICNAAHRFLIAASLQEAGVAHGGIILEPVGRNTAAAACVAARHALAMAAQPACGGPPLDAPPAVLLLPADHLIADRQALRETVSRALDVAAAGRLVTFGIQPTGPHTGYGYIKAGPRLADGSPGFAVAQFVEKPDRETACRYLEAGGFYWNSGIYLYDPELLLRETQRHAPQIDCATERAYGAIKADLDFLRLDAEAFGAAPDISLDYAVMEKTENGAVVPADFAWSDIGSWQALWEHGRHDERGNLLHGDVIEVDNENTYVHNDSDLLTAAIGLRDTIVVATDDALLVCDRGQAERVKDVVALLKENDRREAESHRTVYRPWGSFKSLDSGAGHQVKEIEVKPGAALSLQYHHHRAEHWVIVEGVGEVTRGDEVFPLAANQSTYIEVGQVHRLKNPGPGPLRLIEVQCGDYLGEDDIVRLADDFARHK